MGGDEGNDILMGVPDVMVMDSLTGNVLIKVLSAYSSGGIMSSGPGYGQVWERTRRLSVSSPRLQAHQLSQELFALLSVPVGF